MICIRRGSIHGLEVHDISRDGKLLVSDGWSNFKIIDLYSEVTMTENHFFTIGNYENNCGGFAKFLDLCCHSPIFFSGQKYDELSIFHDHTTADISWQPEYSDYDTYANIEKGNEIWLDEEGAYSNVSSSRQGFAMIWKSDKTEERRTKYGDRIVFFPREPEVGDSSRSRFHFGDYAQYYNWQRKLDDGVSWDKIVRKYDQYLEDGESSSESSSESSCELCKPSESSSDDLVD